MSLLYLSGISCKYSRGLSSAGCPIKVFIKVKTLLYNYLVYGSVPFIMRLPCLFTDLFIITIVIIIIIFFFGWGGQPDPWTLRPFFFRPSGAPVWFKNKGNKGGWGPSPGSVTARSLINSVVGRIKITLWKLIEVVIPKATSS